MTQGRRETFAVGDYARADRPIERIQGVDASAPKTGILGNGHDTPGAAALKGESN